MIHNRFTIIDPSIIYIYIHTHSIRLGYHFQKASGKREIVFKYKLKAGDQAISRGAYYAGYQYLESAASLAVKPSELQVLQEVITVAITELKVPTIINMFLASTSKNSSSSSNSTSSGSVGDTRMKDFKRLQEETENKLNKIKIFHSGETSKLQWQASFAASKFSIADEEEDNKNSLMMNQCVKCVIS